MNLIPMTKVPPPPEGCMIVATGAVRIGDFIWAPSTQRWLEVDKDTRRDLEFLDAVEVVKLIAVARKV